MFMFMLIYEMKFWAQKCVTEIIEIYDEIINQI